MRIKKARFGKLKLLLFGAIFSCLMGSLLAVGFNPPYWVYPAIVGTVAVFFSVKVLKELKIAMRLKKAAK